MKILMIVAGVFFAVFFVVAMVGMAWAGLDENRSPR